MKTWLILLSLVATLMPISSEEVALLDSTEEAGNKNSELAQLTNSSKSDETIRSWWPAFLWKIKMPSFLAADTQDQVTLDTDQDDAMEKLEEQDRQKEENHEKKEATDLVVASNEIVEGEEHEDPTKENRIFEDNVLESLNATEMPPTVLSTAEPATTLTTAAETTDTTCVAKQCQVRVNPWATCTNSTQEDTDKLSEAVTEFAIKLYKTTIQQEKQDSNLVFSPVSVAMVLSNLLLGACGETKNRLEKLLSYPEGFTCVHKALETFHKTKSLTSANAIFFQPALTLGSDFLNLTQEFYQTKMIQLTNNSYQDVVDINTWVSENTNNKIKKLVDELDSDIQMMLLNAVYFHSKWKTVFKVKNTNKEKFYLSGFRPIEVLMMMSKKYPVASFIDQSLQAKVGRLKLSDNMSLVIILPSSISQNLSQVEERLTATVFKSVMAKLESTPFKPTVVTLPKFKVDSSQNLMEIIGEIDYGLFFDANLCEISTDEELAVSNVLHRAVLEINEEGVEAAAATAVSLARTANFFEVHQPFLFSVVKDNGFPVFMGRINHPQSA